MFSPYETGSYVDIDYEGSKGPIRVYVPPEGYVLDQFPKSETRGKLVRTPTMFIGEAPKNQKWKREPYPENWKKLRTEEKRVQAMDPLYSNPGLDDFRYRQWFNRYNGVWIAVWDPHRKETEKIYLTGMHWMYLQWWKCDFGYPDFRYIDVDVFYLLQYAIEDPDSMGVVMATLRRFGKTAILGLWNLEYVSRTKNTYAGLQSTTDKDAKKVFTLSIIYPWKYLPDFFRPIYDYNSTQQADLAFKTPTPKGKSQLLIDAEDSKSLHSYITYRDAQTGAYDGYKIHRMGIEEPGKCFGKGTMVRMYDGSAKPIECLVVGDKIMGDDSTPRKVLELYRGREKMYQIESYKSEGWSCNENHILALRATTGGRIVGYKKNELVKIKAKEYVNLLRNILLSTNLQT